MTHIKPGGVQAAPPRTTPTLEPPPAAEKSIYRMSLDRHRLSVGIAERQQQLHELESELVAACEAAAVRNATQGVSVADRGTWDRRMWEHYLGAAAALEDEFGPKMRRLLRQIDQLERLLKLPVAT